MKIIFLFLLINTTISFSKPIVLFVHGMGGKGNFKFCVGFDEINEKFDNPFEQRFYEWNSNNIPLEILNGVIDKYKESIRLVESKEYLRFQELLFKLEEGGKPYYIVGFSMGAYLTYKALSENRDHTLKNLKGIYFMGAAYERIYNDIDKTTIPNVQRIINYYSRNYDVALKLFHEVSGIEAGGRVGFDDYTLYNNYRSITSHELLINYSTLMESLFGIILLNEGLIEEKENLKLLNRNVSKGLDNWSDIYSFKEMNSTDSSKIVIQKIKIPNLITKKYRAVIVKNREEDNIKIAENNDITELLGYFVEYDLYIEDGSVDIVNHLPKDNKISSINNYQVSFSSFNLKKYKSNGKSWDNFSGKPDIFIEFIVDGDRIRTDTIEDRYYGNIDFTTTFEGDENSTILIKVYDDDVSGDDELGVYTMTLKELKEKSSLSFGSVLKLEISISNL